MKHCTFFMKMFKNPSARRLLKKIYLLLEHNQDLVFLSDE